MITHYCFHKKAKQGCSNHYKDIRVQNRTEVIQTADCVPYPKTSYLVFLWCFVSGHNASLFKGQKNTEAVLQGNFSYMYHEQTEGYVNLLITVMLNLLMSQVSTQALD